MKKCSRGKNIIMGKKDGEHARKGAQWKEKINGKGCDNRVRGRIKEKIRSKRKERRGVRRKRNERRVKKMEKKKPKKNNIDL